MRIVNLLLAVSISVVSCERQEVNNADYFNVNELLDQQIALLSNSKTVVNKEANIDSLQEQSTFVPDSLGWANELEVFRYLEVINKPIYQGLYEQVDQKDEHSNLKVRVLKAKADVPVREFKIYYQDTFDHLKKIEAEIEEKNSLYYSSRKLSLQFDDMLLSKYRISGVQKMIMRDSVRYSIESKVLINQIK